MMAKAEREISFVLFVFQHWTTCGAMEITLTHVAISPIIGVIFIK